MSAIATHRHAPTRGATAQRLFDLAIAIPALVLTAPIVLLAALAVRLDTRGPAFFLQPRTGRHRHEFTIVKLRTMYVDNDDTEFRRRNEAEMRGEVEALDGVAFKDVRDPRITRVGAILRRFSIDELPQLFNVLRGDMSIVGPRPSLTWESEMFPAWAEARFDVRPGLTGVWQVEGRNNVSMPEMLEMDCEYARSRSVLGDASLLLRTVPAVLDARGSA